MKDNKLAFTFASSEVNKIGQQFIKIIELLTGKLILKKLYYVSHFLYSTI